MRTSGIDYAQFIGKEFDRWKVISVGPKKESHQFLICQCKCGTTREVRHTALVGHGKNKSRSCGCLCKDLASERSKLNSGIAHRNRVFYSYKYRAKKKNVPFLLSIEEFESIGKEKCYYCSAMPSPYSKKNTQMNGAYIANGIDRKYPEKGYIIENCVPCCSFCNGLKSNIPFDVFIAHICRMGETLRRP